MTGRFASFRELYPFYLAEHANRTSRRLHHGHPNGSVRSGRRLFTCHAPVSGQPFTKLKTEDIPMRASQEPAGLVLIVEDNRNISEMVGEYLEGRGFEVDYASDGLDGYRLAAENSYDVVVLDLMLPRLDGVEVCKRLREEARKSTPVLMLTARDTLDEKLTGLSAGADDYLTKPFAIQELEARLRALIRRERRQVGSEVLKVADLVLDPASLRATRGGVELQLSPIGLKLLTILMRESPRVVSRQEIEREIWGNGLPDSDTLRSHLYNLRKTIDKPYEKPLLHTVQSAGYRIADIEQPPV
jgi:DNA-binding response OmpR family regulator